MFVSAAQADFWLTIINGLDKNMFSNKVVAETDSLFSGLSQYCITVNQSD